MRMRIVRMSDAEKTAGSMNSVLILVELKNCWLLNARKRKWKESLLLPAF